MSLAALAATTAASAGLIAGGVAYAALYPQSQIFGSVLVAGRDPSQIALTFDDGPNPAATPELLDLLAQHDLRATFFLIGRFALAQPGLARRIAAAGHVIGNHTMTHPWLPLVGGGRIRSEIGDAQAAIEDTLGATVRLFRPPHGARTPAVLGTARDLGLTTVQWNIIGNDWKRLSPGQIAARVHRGILRNQRGRRASNIVLHDGDHTAIGADRGRSIEATARILGLHRDARFVTVDDWL